MKHTAKSPDSTGNRLPSRQERNSVRMLLCGELIEIGSRADVFGGAVNKRMQAFIQE